MLQDVAVNDAVDALGHVERQRVVFDIDGRELIQPLHRQVGDAGVLVDAQQPGARVALAVGGAERGGAAADVQHHAGGERNPLQQVGIRQVWASRHGRKCSFSGMVGGAGVLGCPTIVATDASGSSRRRASGGRRNPAAGASAIRVRLMRCVPMGVPTGQAFRP